MIICTCQKADPTRAQMTDSRREGRWRKPLVGLKAASGGQKLLERGQIGERELLRGLALTTDRRSHLCQLATFLSLDLLMLAFLVLRELWAS